MKNLVLFCVIFCVHLSSEGQTKVLKQHGIRSVETQITNTNKPERSFTLKQSYNKKGNLIEEIKTDYTGKVVEHIVVLNEKNKKTTIKKDISGNDISCEIIIKNKDGNVIETSSENFLKHTKEVRKYSYNKWGKLTAEFWFNEKNEIERSKNYFYNNEGLLIKQVSMDDSNKVIFQKDIHYED